MVRPNQSGVRQAIYVAGGHLSTLVSYMDASLPRAISAKDKFPPSWLWVDEQLTRAVSAGDTLAAHSNASKTVPASNAAAPAELRASGSSAAVSAVLRLAARAWSSSAPSPSPRRA